MPLRVLVGDHDEQAAVAERELRLGEPGERRAAPRARPRARSRHQCPLRAPAVTRSTVLAQQDDAEHAENDDDDRDGDRDPERVTTRGEATRGATA